ncbi:SMAD/FHA domain-containing protein [Chlamydoabsidia padenii]|nr:SMAD/FHA domain-containing protein [Chlamydoabsidia padenii]
MPTGRLRTSATENRQGINVLPPPPPTSVSTSRINNDPTGQEHRIRLVPNVGTTTRCFVFDVIERTLQSGMVLKLGRYSDRNSCADRLSFKSKVVSRCHAELWQEDGKIYIKDTGSSSGTFVNRARLGPANTSSGPYIIQDGDLIQLGVDYKGGVQPMYRAVRIRFEVDRTPTLQQQTAFSRVAFQVQECCICLYSMGPGQALFITPCSHIYHYRCLRPILTQNFPGFSCPLCRTYSDLDAMVISLQV